MRINTNMAALNAWRSMSTNQGNLQKSLERLSSGYRINQAADDAAGLAVSEKMRAQIRGLSMATRNTQDAVSLVQTAEGGASKIQDMLQRMRELAVQASSDTLQDTDRAQLQQEFSALQSEIDRTSGSVTFNGRALINGSSGDQATAATGTTGVGNLKASGLSASLTTRNLAFTNTTVAVAEVQKSSGYNDGVGGGAFAVGNKLNDAVNGFGANLASAKMTFSQNGKSVTIDFAATDTGVAGAATVADLTGSQFIDYVNAKATNAGMSMRLAYDAGANFAINSNQVGTAGNVTVAQQGFAGGATFGFAVTTAGANATVTGLTDQSTGAALSAGTDYTVSGNTVTLKGTYAGVSFDVTAGGGSGSIQITRNNLTFQVGANQNDTISASLGNLSSQNLGVASASIGIGDKSGATSAISALDTALSTVSTERAKMGAMQNRMENAISSLQTQSENLTAAESRIRDVDMASEMAQFTKYQVLSQASTAMLAQANQLSQGILTLLR